MNEKFLKKAKKVQELIRKTISAYPYESRFYKDPKLDLIYEEINKELEELPIEEQIKIFILTDPKGDEKMCDEIDKLFSAKTRKNKKEKKHN